MQSDRVRGRLMLPLFAFMIAATPACRDGTEATHRSSTGLVAALQDFTDTTGGGIAVAVIDGDGNTELSTNGSAGRDGTSPVADATSFRVASVTKTYLATLALMLVDDGRLALDTPLRSLFDQVGAWGDVTVRQLLSHTSGLPRSGPRLDPSTWHTPADVPLDALCAPGKCRNYADENYVVVGSVIERVTGAPLERALHERIVAPLDLNRTFLEPAEQPTPPVAQHPVRPVWKPIPLVVANAEDLARFGHALFGGELLSVQSLEAMVDFEATADVPCAEDCHMPPRYGLGVIRYPDVGTCAVWGHDGSTGSYLGYVPSQRRTIAVLTNVEPWPEGFGPSIVPAATGGTCS
jgi:D-alanyl-D-alanine carboxypeptidase